MTVMTRREAIKAAAAIGAALAWSPSVSLRSPGSTVERRDLFPQGVASGDPQSTSVLLWTRRPPAGVTAQRLRLEVSDTPTFRLIVARAESSISSESDWTCRVLAAGLQPNREYWFRFTDEHRFTSRIGRTITAPLETDARPVRFAFVSCQNVQLGACNAFRRMISDDEGRARPEQLDFVLHLGDFVYEILWYPDERPRGTYGRRVRDIVRYRDGEKHGELHVPTTLRDYRDLYCAYLLDPDLQDARARWPFVCLPDNHEFSWKGWQSQENFGTGIIPAQTRKVAANQAWFEYQPARLARPGLADGVPFQTPKVADAPIKTFDAYGLGLEAGNLSAISSLRASRAMRWGRNVELLLTDNRSHRSEPLTDRPETAPFRTTHFPGVVAQDVTEILDAGRAFNGGNPPATIRFAGADLPNPRRHAEPLSMLGAEQKRWFLDHLRTSSAPWKLWGNTVAMLDWRIDLQNLPESFEPRWPTTGYALFGDDDWSGYHHERNEILDFVRREEITGVATLCGDRHAFLAGLLKSSSVSPDDAPIAPEFVTGSISAPGLFEAFERGIPQSHPLRPIYVYQPDETSPAQPAVNLSITHGVMSSLTLQRTGDAAQAAAAANPSVAPEISFADVGGHGYAIVRAEPTTLTVEFVCIPRPLERSETSDGGPVVYRITHQTQLWARGESPRLATVLATGALPLGSRKV
jgi:alkaline phosphatase D